MDRGKRDIARAEGWLVRLGGGMKRSMAAVWIIVGAMFVAAALMWAAHSSPVPPGAERAPKPISKPQADRIAAPAAPPTAPAGRVEPPIRDDLVIYYLGDFRSHLTPCG